jgi:hypothetical protein
MHLSRLVGRPTSDQFGGETIVLADQSDARHIDSFRKDFATLRQKGVVVYIFAPTTTGMATIRFESSESGKFSERIVSRTKITEEQFEDNVNLARQAARGANARKELRSSLLGTDLSQDAGKLVIFKDLNFYGVLPQTFELDEGVMLVSGNIKKAVANAELLTTEKLAPKEISAFVGYPETPEQFKAVFEEESKPPLPHWQDLMTGMRDLGKTYGFDVYGLRDMDGLGSKEAVLNKISQSKNIVWVVAHAKDCFIRLTSGELIQIAPSDIESLQLVNSPLVVVRVCDAVESGFPRAFLKAGARAVSVNRGKISASNVNNELAVLLNNLKDSTFYEAIRKTNASGIANARANGLYVELGPMREFPVK